MAAKVKGPSGDLCNICDEGIHTFSPHKKGAEQNYVVIFGEIGQNGLPKRGYQHLSHYFLKPGLKITDITSKGAGKTDCKVCRKDVQIANAPTSGVRGENHAVIYGPSNSNNGYPSLVYVHLNHYNPESGKSGSAQVKGRSKSVLESRV